MLCTCTAIFRQQLLTCDPLLPLHAVAHYETVEDAIQHLKRSEALKAFTRAGMRDIIRDRHLHVSPVLLSQRGHSFALVLEGYTLDHAYAIAFPLAGHHPFTFRQGVQETGPNQGLQVPANRAAVPCAVGADSWSA